MKIDLKTKIMQVKLSKGKNKNLIKKRKKTKIQFQQVVLKKSVITTGKDGSKFPINELKKCDERAALHIKKLCHCTKQNYI